MMPVRFFAAAVALVLAGAAHAQDTRPLQFIVGYSPGGGTDTAARVLGDSVTRSTGRSVVVKNLAGAGGQIAASTALREGADGTAVLVINHPDLYLAVQRDPAALKLSDFDILMADLRDPRMIVVKNESDLTSFTTLVERARAQPGKLAASVTAAGGQELFAKWLFPALKLDVTIAGYRGGSDAGNALMTGDVQMTIGDDYSRLNMRDQARALLIGARERSPRWPEAPTIAEALAPLGITPPTPDFASRYGMYVVPASLKASRPAVRAELQRVLLAAMGTPEYKDYIAKNKLADLVVGQPGEVIGRLVEADVAAIDKMK
jgi:tripartite-type tricarboxylate transporter receptor subunit TctC